MISNTKSLLTNKEYQKINNLFISDDTIKNYIQQIKKRNKADIYKHFSFHDGHLFYKSIQIMKSTEIPPLLLKLYREDANLQGKSVVTAYKYIRQFYGNITREDIQEFLMKQPEYQMTSQLKKIIKRPIVAKYSNEIWSIDLIDVEKYMGINKRKKYIFNAVDVFSRKCWLEPMANKEASTALKCLETIIQRAGVTPVSIRCDNGGEFHGEFADYCNEQGIHIIYSQSHTPTQNAIVERCNKDVRKIMNAFFIKHQTNNWVDHLSEIENSKNTSYNSTIKSIPNNVWSPTKEKVMRVIPAYLANENPVLVTRNEILQKAIKAKEKYANEDNFQEGDRVRVRMDALFANQRAEIKKNNSKQLVIRYSPEIFTIYKVIHSNVGHNKYILINDDDYQLGVQGKLKYFKADELILASEPTNFTSKMALKMNQIEPTKNDVIVD